MISTGNKAFLHNDQCCVLFGKRTMFVIKNKGILLVSDTRRLFLFSAHFPSVVP